MPLKLTLKYGDIVQIGENITAKVRSLSNINVCLEIDAPQSVDISRNSVDKSVHVPKGQRLTPEKQREIALNQFKNRGFKR